MIGESMYENATNQNFYRFGEHHTTCMIDMQHPLVAHFGNSEHPSSESSCAIVRLEKTLLWESVVSGLCHDERCHTVRAGPCWYPPRPRVAEDSRQIPHC